MRFALPIALLTCCVFSFAAQSQNTSLEKLSPEINTNFDEIAPVISRDGSTMYFTRLGHPDFNRTLWIDGKDISTSDMFLPQLKAMYETMSGTNIIDPIASPFNQDVWVANLRTQAVTHPDYPLNDAMPNSICSITPNLNEFIIVNQKNDNGETEKGFSLIRKNADGTWASPQPLIIDNFYTNSADVSLTMSENGEILILSLNRRDSNGNNDLYVSHKKTDGTWTEPHNLGGGVNSEARETTPFLSGDTKTLYFSSNRSGSMGGSDIYMTERIMGSWNLWLPPVRLDVPFNSGADDGQPYFCEKTGDLYFTSKRAGNSDIYKATFAPKSLMGAFINKTKQDVPGNVNVRVKLMDEKTEKPIDGIVYMSLGENGTFKPVKVTKQGEIQTEVPKGVPIYFKAERNGYQVSQPKSIAFERSYFYFKTYDVSLTIRPMEAGMKIELNPIFFEQSEARILPQSNTELERLYQFLRTNEGFFIRIEGHTDNQGDQNALQQLSDDRAWAVKEALIKKGIHPIRMKAVGFGAKRPINTTDTDEGRSKNRRVEVYITEIVTPTQ
jgi:OmpA-OmpF porin, OOP family